MKDIRRLINPRKRVFICPIQLKDIVVNENSQFNMLLSENEQLTILQQDGKGKTLFNGRAVRLDELREDGTAVLSIVGFFDFMTTNLVVKPASRTKKTAFGNLYSALFSAQVKTVSKLEHRVKAAVYSQKRKSFTDILAIRELANIVTVSILIKDSMNRVLLVHRGNKVAISSGNFATSCTGSLAEEDLSRENPFIACAQRELKEELNLDCKLYIVDIAISKQKLQPAVLLCGSIESKFEDLYKKMISAPDFREENSELFAVPVNALPGIVKRHQFTDVAAYQLAGKISNWASVIPHSIEKYKLNNLDV